MEYTRPLKKMLHEFALQLKSHFSEAITRDPSGFKKQVVRLIRRELPPRRGRPNDPRIDAAFFSIHHGKSVRDVLRSQIAGFDTIDAYSRYLAEKSLRAALARRREASPNSSACESKTIGRPAPCRPMKRQTLRPRESG